jgi:hypothetical protein
MLLNLYVMRRQASAKVLEPHMVANSLVLLLPTKASEKL